VSIWAVEQTSGAVMAHNFLPQIGQAYAFIFGNEVNGVSEKALQWCDGAIEIPQFGTKHSLNVAVAAGIMAWECSRKLRANLAKP
jgi:tRNA G18 (ribose-2'-O)-methylase SpoU